MIKLTDISVRNAKPDVRARRQIPDKSGVYLMIQPSGHKSFATFVRLQSGKQIKITHGEYPTLSLEDARVLHAETVKQAKAGADPRDPKKDAERHRLEAEANTFRVVAEDYLSTDKMKKKRTVDQIRDKLERLVFPTLGDKPVADITRKDIAALLGTMARRNGPVAADRAMSAISGVCKHYRVSDSDYVLPIIPEMKHTNAKDRARKRVLNDAEIKAVWNTGDMFVRFLLLTAARRDEVASMQWKEINGSDWTLPAERNKAKVDLIRPLPKAALALLPPRTSDEDYIFGVVPTSPLTSFDRIKKRLDEASGVTGWRLHDLRRTAKTRMAKAGVPRLHSEQCLGHTIKGVEGVYDQFDYLSEKRQAYQMLAAHIQGIVDPPRGNVTPMRRRHGGKGATGIGGDHD
jgi:integrase